MSKISIIGTGNMARTIGVRAVASGNTVEVMGRDQSKAADLAKALGGSATTGEWGTAPVRRRSRGQGHRRHQQSLQFHLRRASPPRGDLGRAGSRQGCPASASVVKGFNTIFRHVLEKGRPDVFIAGDSAQAKASVETFIESLGLRPLDVGGLKMAHWLEGAGVVTVGLASHGIGNLDFALSITELTGRRREQS
jgi:8-hydroxy-5-deazaflavin:NADPH oxidoreductase